MGQRDEEWLPYDLPDGPRFCDDKCHVAWKLNPQTKGGVDE